MVAAVCLMLVQFTCFLSSCRRPKYTLTAYVCVYVYAPTVIGMFNRFDTHAYIHYSLVEALYVRTVFVCIRSGGCLGEAAFIVRTCTHTHVSFALLTCEENIVSRGFCFHFLLVMRLHFINVVRSRSSLGFVHKSWYWFWTTRSIVKLNNFSSTTKFLSDMHWHRRKKWFKSL